MNPSVEAFLSCDWGTSSFRLRLVDAEGQILRQTESSRGVKALAERLPPATTAADRSRAFHDYLATEATCLLKNSEGDTPEPHAVVVSGMASSSVGWEELPYSVLPFPVDGSQVSARWLELNIPGGNRMPLLLISGLASEDDIIRGEETQVIGLLAMPQHERFVQDGLIVLPGTHSKHIRVREGHVVDFRTYLTGELFAVLREHSILRFTTDDGESSLDEVAFAEGIEAARTHGLSRSLFRVRTRAILQGKPGGANTAFLSGLLVGAEMLDSVKGTDSTPILLAAAGSLSERYRWAARLLGLDKRVKVVDDECLGHAVVAGQRLLLAEKSRIREEHRN